MQRWIDADIYKTKTEEQEIDISGREMRHERPRG